MRRGPDSSFTPSSPCKQFEMASGVAVAPNCVSTFQELKLRKQLKFIIYALNDTKTEVVVHKTSSSFDYEEFLGDLPENECRWAVYDFEYDNGEGKRNRLLFYSWSPDTARIKEKMVYAASKDALRKSLDGIASEIQGTDSSEVSYETVRTKVK